MKPAVAESRDKKPCPGATWTGVVDAFRCSSGREFQVLHHSIHEKPANAR